MSDATFVEPSSLRASQRSGDVVVFDFDGTLVNRDSFSDFAVGYCVSRPLRLFLVLLFLPLSATLLALGSKAAAGSILLWGMTVGGSTRRFAVALRLYARGTLPDYANEAIFAELARQVNAGCRVVIATGTVPLLVRGLLSARRVPPLPIVGSRLSRRWGGLVAMTHCTGRVKVSELRRKLGIDAWSTVYTDSFADSALLSGAREITLVSPSRGTVKRTTRLVGGKAALRVLTAVGG